MPLFDNKTRTVSSLGPSSKTLASNGGRVYVHFRNAGSRPVYLDYGESIDAERAPIYLAQNAVFEMKEPGPIWAGDFIFIRPTVLLDSSEQDLIITEM